MSSAENKDVLTVGEAARYLRLHEQTIYHLLRSGRLKGARVGRVWRIHRTALETFLSVDQLPGNLGEAPDGSKPGSGMVADKEA